MQLDNLTDLIQKSVLLALNFIDELAIFTLTRFGLHWPWLHWISTILLVITIAYWGIRLWRYCYRLQQQG
ncbi:hypothetical protein N836_26945 [Leptolyngbya sp. Heron Island J]|uniref:hypothetical protein n=1 Tax=Leptolyngbya sp. Heron Island J TaxID=1385935 RepID=UPI0003B9EED6|nr:hypothetical protein [Leptolyngbya sp. Heron Island J]ESA32230.1 hypothetical protein N836_26945 [Leptolyngbya sp. Heron Island J]